MADTEEKNISTLADSGSSSAGNQLQQAPAALDLIRLNRMLAHFAGKDFCIKVFAGEEIRQLEDSVLRAMAECYSQLAKEKWDENWTSASATEELKKYFQAEEERINLISLVHKGDAVVGLCWAFIFSANNPGDLAAHYSSAKLRNKDNLEATREWIGQVGGKEKLVSIRELGILKQYKKVRAAMLCAPVYAKALEFNCKYIFLRTPVNNKSLKWNIGIGFVPVHYFVVNQMLLMLGNLENTLHEYEYRVLDYFAGQLSTALDEDRDFDAIMQQTEMNYAEKMKVMQSLSANIAHEMRTPLSGVCASMDGIETYLPVLIEIYKKACAENPGSLPVIHDNHITALERTPERISLMIDQANTVIDMLLMNLRDNSVDKRQFEIYSAAECIEQALDRYPFKRGEREKINLDVAKDFYFRGINSLFIYVIFNLLKNALFSLNSALKGEITIQLKAEKGINIVIFRDTGEGIEKEILDQIFDGFFSTHEEGTGVGLPFCLRTMRNFDGDISCTSEAGEYTEFTITLPAV